jgi:hypothetical protein
MKPSSLRTLKIIPRNLNEIVPSWIRLLVVAAPFSCIDIRPPNLDDLSHVLDDLCAKSVFLITLLMHMTVSVPCQYTKTMHFCSITQSIPDSAHAQY